MTDRKLLYKIVCARDKRYDGRFYCGVKTTGVYCRPICPARPLLKNIEFFRSAAEAEKAGYRACLRCRPDLAPNSVQWSGTGALVGRALHLISRGDCDETSLVQLSDKLGVSDRHLRRLFEEHVGASPVEVANSKRLHLAKHLITQSTLSITDIAYASGYRSLRRFNDAFKLKFRTNPRSLRSSKRSFDLENFISVQVPVISPYNWQHIYEFLKNHSAPGVDAFEDQTYRRSFSVQGVQGAFEVSFRPESSELAARISLPDPSSLRKVIERIRDLFDTRTNPHAHLAEITSDDDISRLYRSELGLRIPGAWDSFETAVCIILGQLVSVEQAKLKIAKLVDQFGRKIDKPVFESCTRLFPAPEVLAEANYRNIGITKTREHALRELSKLVAGKQIDLSRSSDIEATKQQLLAIRGIGPWTVEMIAMRCLGDANAFPVSDLIIKRALELHKNQKGDWSPWNSYITLTLWKTYAKTLSKKLTKSSTPRSENSRSLQAAKRF